MRACVASLTWALAKVTIMPLPMAAGVSMETHGEHEKPSADHHAMWEKCGYCTLLFSCPALPGSVSFVALGTPPPANALTPATRLGHARQSIFPGARSRAPPIAS